MKLEKLLAVRKRDLQRGGQRRKTARRDMARKTFCVLLEEMIRKGKLPSAYQFQGLYLALRHVARIGNHAKMQHWTRYFSGRTVAKCRHLTPRENKASSGVIGGAKGSVVPELKTAVARRRLFRLLRGVARSQSQGEADKHVAHYVADGPVAGLGRSVISSFLWAIRPDAYPVVNGGNIESLRKCIDGFPAANKIEDYVAFDIPCLRKFKIRYGIENMSDLDHILCDIPKSASVDSSSRFTYSDDVGMDRKSAVEGNEVSKVVRGRLRSARLRQQVLLDRGYTCEVCELDPEVKYGVKYAHVHHETHLCRGLRKTNPEKDLVVLCASCHSILHSTPYMNASWKALKRRLDQQRHCQKRLRKVP